MLGDVQRGKTTTRICKMRYLSTLSLALIVHVLRSIVVLMALACTATPATPAPTPDVPLLDEETVVSLVRGHVGDGMRDSRLEYCYREASGFDAEYIGKNIWVATPKTSAAPCTFTVHDKEAHVILSQQDKTSD